MSIDELIDLKEETLHKEKIHHNRQICSKVFLNSLYGAMGSKYFHYYDMDLANAVTTTGQFIVQEMMQKLEHKLQSEFPSNSKYVIYGDTDSCYIAFDHLVNLVMPNDEKLVIIDKLCKFCDDYLSSYLDTVFDDVMNRQNSLDRAYKAGREIIGSPGIFIKKKKYTIKVYDNEGVRLLVPKKKTMGLELIKSSTPEVCRNWLSEAVDILMDGSKSELEAYIKTQYTLFKSLSLEDISSTRGIRSFNHTFNSWIEKEWRKTEYPKPRAAQTVYDHKDSEYIAGMKKIYSKECISNNGNIPKFWETRQTLLGQNKTVLLKGCPIHVRAMLSHNHCLTDDDNILPIVEGDKMKFTYLKEPNPYYAYNQKSNVMGFLNGVPKNFDPKYIDFKTQFEKYFISPLDIIRSVISEY